MDIGNLAPDLAKLFGIQPSTMVLLIIIITTVANRTARLIPDDATGWKGNVRFICSIIGAHVSSRVTSGVTQADVAKAAAETPAIAQQVKADKADA